MDRCQPSSSDVPKGAEGFEDVAINATPLGA